MTFARVTGASLLTDLQLQAPPLTLAKGASLFLDFDGTLVEFANRPDAVVVLPRVRDLLARLVASLEGRVAIVSGRSIAQIAALLPIEGLAIAGSHGIERQSSDGSIHAVERPAALDAALVAMAALRERFPGIVIEDKPHGVALHYRQTPQAEAEGRALITEIAKRTGLPVQAGKMVFELKSAATGKGDAIEAFLREPPMAGTVPLFFGDDLTDEPGFGVARRFGGAGVVVGSAHETSACYRLDDVDAVLGWLEAAFEVQA